MIDPKPSAWTCPIPGPHPWRSQRLATLGTLSACQAARAGDEVRRNPEPRPVAVRPALFPGPGTPIGVCSRWLWAKAWRPTRTLS